ncbi:MAG: PA0069 family radical SAM protein [Lysobacterales bacterium]
MRGRGALSNPEGRFNVHHHVPDPDVDLGPNLECGSRSARLVTRVRSEPSRRVISRNNSSDIPFNLSVNPYRGCEHGCIYCYARPGHAYLGLSPGLDFETQIFAKPQAPQRLEQELRAPSYQCQVIAMGANTDAYQPAERRLGITRQLLKVMNRFSQPVSLITKSSLILRDKALLSAMARRRLAQVSVSVTSLCEETKRRLEPRTASAQVRLKVIRELTEAGIPVNVMVAPVIPKITEHEMEDILGAAAEAGAVSASYILLRLPGELESLFAQWLEEHYPNRQQAVMNLLRQCHGGDVYRGGFGRRMRGQGPFADLYAQRFAKASKRCGLARREIDLDTAAFSPPAQAGDQMTLAL